MKEALISLVLGGLETIVSGFLEGKMRALRGFLLGWKGIVFLRW